MRNLSVRTRLILGFSAVILIMVVLTGLVYNGLVQIHRETLDVTTDSLPAMWLTSRIAAASQQDYALAQKLLLSSDQTRVPATLARVQTLQTQLDGWFKEAAAVHQDKGRQDLEAIVQARTLYLAARQEAIKTRSVPLAQHEEMRVERQLETNFTHYNTLLSARIEADKKLMDQSAGEVLDAVGSAQRTAILGVVLSILLAALITYLLAGDFTALIGEVQKATIVVNTSVTEIAATSRQQQATASEIAATTTQIGATSKEISATSKELVKSMNQVAGVAEQTATLAASGQTGLGRMQSTMHQIMEASSSINARLAVLNEKAGNINTVVTTIAKVADQTNLLSLNAAIEAEKAGEYGRGFAVVATEIRRLADQTAVATLDIEQMVKEMQSAVSAGVMGMDKFAEEVRRGVEVAGQVSQQLSQIIEQVQLLTPNFEVVNEGMQSQSLGAQQISDALTQLSEAAQQTVESLRQSNLAIEQTNDSVRGLQSGVSRFMPAA